VLSAENAPVTYTVERGIATITLDSPGNRNALSERLVSGLLAFLQTAAADDNVRAVVLTHTGPTFCAGMDLKEAALLGMKEATARIKEVLQRIVELPVPVIAHLRGNARAGGLGIIGACDFAFAPDDATFAFSEVRLGLAPAIISLTTLTRLNAREASRYYLTGDTFDGAVGVEIGLLTAAGDSDVLLSATLASLRKCSRQGLVETKKILNSGLAAKMAAEGDEVVRKSAELFASEEAAEGMAAFREKRPARWVS
jgi:enoyl-CoA hydratase